MTVALVVAIRCDLTLFLTDGCCCARMEVALRKESTQLVIGLCRKCGTHPCDASKLDQQTAGCESVLSWESMR